MNFGARWTGTALVAALAGGLAEAQLTERVSLGSGGLQGNADSYAGPLSADGRFVAFASYADNLVAGDTNGVIDAFVRDRLSGATERVSVASAGGQADGCSDIPSISADGRYVAFFSHATNLVTGDTNGVSDVFVRDRRSRTTERVSVATGGAQANSDSYSCCISADGRFVAFSSNATNLVAGDTNMASDVFVRDRLNGTTERVSVDSAGAQADGGAAVTSISADGRFVAFYSSATNLVAGDTNGVDDVFVRDRQLGTTERVSVSSAGAQGNDYSLACSISADGRLVAFESYATNLVAGDTNVSEDMFVHDRQTGLTERVSVSTGGAQGSSTSAPGQISASGRYVVFESVANNLVAGDTNHLADIFVRDRQLGSTVRVSVDSGGAQGNADSEWPSISSDGRFVTFTSSATNFVAGDTNGALDAFLRDRGAPPPSPFCSGDGSAGACPCGNNGATGRGCQNSASTGGALLAAAGSSSLPNDTLVLTSSGELPAALSIFLQGTNSIAPLVFGDGLRCTGGTLLRLYVHDASGGAVSAPQPGDASISARSAALGNVIGAGTTRYYQTYYRDPLLGFCASPPGNTWNVSSGLSIAWN
jgi:Tol biopolymer transport system component